MNDDCPDAGGLGAVRLSHTGTPDPFPSGLSIDATITGRFREPFSGPLIGGGPRFFALAAAAAAADDDGVDDARAAAADANVDAAAADADTAAAAFARALSDKISFASRVAVVRHHFFVAQKTSTDMSRAKASYRRKTNRGVGRSVRHHDITIRGQLQTNAGARGV